ncbi:hypothetical protein GCM10008171_14530 [Methylopila jiangsuensis]|uniref:Uncharacterized protein n=1 Tax=Methylopila jiangsuensis TaxID=586230 RepID=A0A9W6JHL0_9HYPH|nr:hypothetical protein [Methylopila jiangsuensis]MDR6284284.1 hypothetical protein [Methylopila jiangsuensis]GLK76199.1 hypothetical protein GCM10008171_14530 [Methylopila jiangsuensis]
MSAVASEIETLAPPAAPSREEMIQANVDPDTGLATDYLNHFNEMIMLLELLGDMPELVDDVLDWAPLSYRAHFERSALSGRHVAIAAYEAADPRIRAAFDAAIADLNGWLSAAQGRLRDAPADAVPRLAPGFAAETRPLLARADAVIHGDLSRA